MTRAELARRAGLPRETVSRLEHGRPARPESIRRLADALVVAPRVLTDAPDLDDSTDEGFRTCVRCGVHKPLRAFAGKTAACDANAICTPCEAAGAKSSRRRDSLGPAQRSALAEMIRARQTQKAEGVLTCKACAATRPLTEFLRIKQSRQAYHGRCRACRVRRARELYQADPEERARQKERARRNRARRKQPVT